MQRTGDKRILVILRREVKSVWIIQAENQPLSRRGINVAIGNSCTIFYRFAAGLKVDLVFMYARNI